MAANFETNEQLQRSYFRKSLFIFRRDLRLQDNTALIAALKSSQEVIPCFIFDPRQIEMNSYLSKNALQFMIESLKELDTELKKMGSRLYIFDGEAASVVEQLINNEAIESIFVNRDYTPFSRMRDAQLKELAQKKNIVFQSHFDLLLTEVGSVLTGKGTPYTIFSHFVKKAVQIPVRKPEQNRLKNYFKNSIAFEKLQAFESVLPESDYNRQAFVNGGRRGALKILTSIENFKQYDEERNFPAKEATTGLSAHNKFGTVSIREVYHRIEETLGSSHGLIRELYWRDFFSHVAYNFPHVFGHTFHRKYDGIKWKRNYRRFKSWCQGKTGFPIVDAGMRQLNATGFMHNRVRMIVASFLVKDLHIDWRWGEKYFAQKLIDYDPAVNNGNWQWAASTGCDAQPYFRTFNPWIQAKKFDPECEYIKKWIPELRAFDAKMIEKLEKGEKLAGYVESVVDHSEAKEIAEDLYIAAADRYSK